MNHPPILLSLCVPTYNRVGTLMCMLKHIVSDPDYNDDVEIVISDNCSTDDTEKQVRSFASNYTNVKYFRNNENVRDRNFYLALSRGEGRYLKLLNDYVAFKDGGLKEMKDFIRRYESEDVNLLFYSRLRSPYRRTKEVVFENVDSFVRSINNKMTWISNYGVWKRNFAELRDDAELWNTQLGQMEWTLHGASLRKTVVVNCHSFETLDVPNKKMSYAFFMPHVVHYYGIYQTYVDKGLISKETIAYDKYRVLSHFVGSRIIQYLYLEKDVPFDKTKARKILDSYFGDIPYYRYLKAKGQILARLQKSGLLPTFKFVRKSVNGFLKDIY